MQQRFKITGTALFWIKSYMSQHFQKVACNGQLSESILLNHGVPQGSCLGPIAFLAYISAIDEIAIQYPNITIHSYADDTQLYLSCSPSTLTQNLSQLEKCINDIRHFFLAHQLKINDNKTEFLIIGSTQQLNKVNMDLISLRVGQDTITPSDKVKNLGVIFDSQLSFKHHINNITRKSYYHLTRIRQIKKYITPKISESLIHSLVSSNLDYCNSLLYNTPNLRLKKLQQVQNCSARILTGTPKFSHITPVLRNLHWLPVRHRIEYKLLLQTYKILNCKFPEYLQNLISRNRPARHLRSINQDRLYVPKTKTILIGSRSFSFSSPTLWNSLPEDLKSQPSINSFKNKLKTFLFKKAFDE